MTGSAGPIRDDELDGLFGNFGCAPLALAVSGGADSMALMHLIARWAASSGVDRWTMNLTVDGWPQRPSRADHPVAAPSWLAHVHGADQLERQGGPPPVIVLTVDHGLRPGSAADAKFVAEAAGSLGLPCEILRWEGSKPKTAVQEAAREARRRLMLAAVMGEHEWVCDLLARDGRMYHMTERTIVMAHHADDQAETFLMRLARGSGLDGLSAIRSPDWVTTDSGASGIISRPLLGVPKARLRATLEAAGIPWREDPSNEDRRFERIRIRQALDVLSELGIGSTEIAASAARLGAARLSYRMLIADGPARSIRWHDGLMAEIDMFRWSPDLLLRIIRGILAIMGGAAKPVRLSQVEALAERLDTHTDETLGGCRVVATNEGTLRIYRETGRGLPTVALAPGDAKPWDGGRFTVALAADCPQPAVSVGALGAEGWAGLKRAVPGLADLRLPAAAVAGLPAFRSADGALLAVPTLDELLLRSGTDDSRRAWSEVVGAPAGACSARFTGAERLHREIS